VCTKAVVVVRAVGADFFLDGWHVEIVSDNSIRHIPWGSTIRRRTFDWKRFRILTLDVEAVPQSWIPLITYDADKGGTTAQAVGFWLPTGAARD
jgi:hypothetical protein